LADFGELDRILQQIEEDLRNATFVRYNPVVLPHPLQVEIHRDIFAVEVEALERGDVLQHVDH
jgi:hypothetical protein